MKEKNIKYETSIKLTKAQASKILKTIRFVKEDGDNDSAKNRLLYNLLTAPIGTSVEIYSTSEVFMAAWLGNYLSNNKTTLICNLSHPRNIRSRQLILNYLKAKNFKEFQVNAPNFLNRSWKDQFHAEFDYTTSRTQIKSNIKFRKVISNLEVKRMNGEYRITIDKMFVGSVSQVIARHIWKYPEHYFALSPLTSEELIAIYNSKDIVNFKTPTNG